MTHEIQIKNEFQVLEKLVVDGDMSALTEQQRLVYYKSRCESAGLDPRSQPFQFLKLNGKLTLYATKAATDQLISNRGLSTEIIDRRTDGDLYEVTVRVKKPDGTCIDNMGIVPIGGLKGEMLANARMKAMTKATRRAVLSACGLGMLDETEVPLIKGAEVVPLPGDSIKGLSAKNTIDGEENYRLLAAKKFIDQTEKIELLRKSMKNVAENPDFTNDEKNALLQKIKEKITVKLAEQNQGVIEEE